MTEADPEIAAHLHEALAQAAADIDSAWYGARP